MLCLKSFTNSKKFAKSASGDEIGSRKWEMRFSKLNFTYVDKNSFQHDIFYSRGRKWVRKCEKQRIVLIKKTIWPYLN